MADVQEALRRFEQGTKSRNSQLSREIQDIKFFNGEQWPNDVVQARAGQQGMGGMPAVPARPCLTINRLIGPVRQVLNEFRAANFAIELTAADDFGELSEPISEQEIEIREGLIRRIQRNSGANSARYWAFERGVVAGLGWYRIVARKLPGSDDQELAIVRIYNQNAVVADPASCEPDGSDMRWCFIGYDLSVDTYKATYGEHQSDENERILRATNSNEEWRSLGDDCPDWFSTSDDGTKSIRVCEYYYIEHDEVNHCTLNGLEVLEETSIPYTPWIPVLKYIGEELQPHDGQWRAQGMVRPSRDGQQAFNFMVSTQIERVGLTPIAPWMVAEGQVEGYENQWDQANTRALNRLTYRTRDLEGNPVGAPIRTPAEADIQAISQSVVMFNEAIQSTILVPDPAQGRINPSLRSAATVRELVEQSDQGTSNYTQNMVDITMFHEARILNAMLPIYAARPGRLISVINGTNQAQQVMLGVPYVQQGNTAKPAPDPTMPDAKMLDFTENAQCNIAIKIVKNFDTRRQEESMMLGQIIQHNPEMFAIYGPLWAKNLDVPGHQEIAKLALAVADPRVQQVMLGQQPIPPQAQAQMAQMQQMIEALEAELSKSQQIIQAKQVEKSADVQQTQMDNATKIQIAEINSGTQLAIADIKAQLDATKLAVEQMRAIVDAAKEEGMAKRAEQHEQHTQAVDKAVEHMALAREHAHDAAMQQREHEHAQAETARQQDHERTMQKEAPKPVVKSS